MSFNDIDSKNGSMSIFPDKPIDSINQDKFENKDFANTIANIIENANKDEHINIALYGPWGTGKSSIGEIVNQNMKNKKNHFVHLNVWKYSTEKGSLVRKFLLEAANVIGLKTDNLEEDLYVSKTTNGPDIKSWWKTFGALQWKITLPIFILVTFIMVLAGNFLGDFESLKSLISDTFPSIIITSFLSIFSSIIVAYFSQLLKMSEIRVQKVDSPISSEEQYEKKFLTLVDKLSDDKRVIFFIDDMDRLVHSKVIEVLETIKTFIEHEKCIFIVACEENILQQAIKQNESIDKNGNSAEYLDKIFQVSLHIPSLYETDLLNYSESLINEKVDSIPFCDLEQSELEDVKVTLIHNQITTPRQVKVQLNDFSAVYQIAKERNLQYVTDNAAFLAKLIAIRNDWPHFYEKLQKDSHLLEEVYIEIGNGNLELSEASYDKYGLSKQEYESLYSFLVRTRNINVYHGIEAFLFLRDTPSSNEKVGGQVVREEIVKALHDGNGEKLIQLSQHWNENQTDVVQFIFEKIDVASPTLKHNARVAFSYVLPYLNENTIRFLNHKINSELLDLLILKDMKDEFSIEGIFSLIPFLDDNSIEIIFNQYSEEWKSLLTEPKKSECMLRFAKFAGDTEKEQTFSVVENAIGINENQFNINEFEKFYKIFSLLDDQDYIIYKNLIWNILNYTINYLSQQQKDDNQNDEVIEKEVNNLDKIIELAKNLFEIYWAKVSSNMDQWSELINLLFDLEKKQIRTIFEDGIEYSLDNLDIDQIRDLVPKLLNPEFLQKLSVQMQQKLLGSVLSLSDESLGNEKLGQSILEAFVYLLCNPETSNQANDIYKRKSNIINSLEIEDFDKAINSYTEYVRNLDLSTKFGITQMISNIIKDIGTHFDNETTAMVMIKQMNELGTLENLTDDDKIFVKKIATSLIKNIVELTNNSKSLARKVYNSWDVNKIINYNISDEIAVYAIKLRLMYPVGGRILLINPIVNAMVYSREGFVFGLKYFDRFFENLKSYSNFNSLLKQWLLSYDKWHDEGNATDIDNLSKSIAQNFSSMKKLGRELLTRLPMQQQKVDKLLKNIGAQADDSGVRKRLYSDIKNELRTNESTEKLIASFDVLEKLKDGDYSDHEKIIFQNFIDWLSDKKIKNKQFQIVLTSFLDFYEGKSRLPYGSLTKIDNMIKKVLKTDRRIEDKEIINILQEVSERHERHQVLEKVKRTLKKAS